MKIYENVDWFNIYLNIYIDIYEIMIKILGEDDPTCITV